eukprot:scaffold31526_cov38-Phaeocystis_antarctica.AAC.3
MWLLPGCGLVQRGPERSPARVCAASLAQDPNPNPNPHPHQDPRRRHLWSGQAGAAQADQHGLRSQVHAQAAGAGLARVRVP